MASSPSSHGPPQRLVQLGRRCLGLRQLDQLARFDPVLDAVLKAPASTSHPTILDVGSGSAGVTTLLPDHWQSTALDSDFQDYAEAGNQRPLSANQVLGDVRDLQFPDRAFDVVVALDVLEHLNPDDRGRAVREIARVSRFRAVIACPAGADAQASDRRIAEWFASRGLALPGWLEEHLENDFPNTDEIAASASEYGEIRVHANESTAAHERLIIAEHMLVPALLLRIVCRPIEWMLRSRRPRLRGVARAILARVRGDDRAPAYRCIVVVDRSPLIAPAKPQTSA